MKRCVLVIPDAGPLNSLWVADRLDLLLRLDMPIVVVDAVYDEVTSNPCLPQGCGGQSVYRIESTAFRDRANRCGRL